MKRTAVVGMAVTMVVFAGGLVAQADSGTIGGGTSLTVTLESPADGAAYVAGNAIPVSGTVVLGEGVAVKDTDLAFVLDVSGSTGTSSGLGCGSILACEIAAVRQIVEDAVDIRSPIANVGVVAFPTRTPVPLTAPNLFPTDLSAFTAGGGTEFEVGITNALNLLGSPTSPTDLIVMFTDGAGTYSPAVGETGVVIKVFTIGGATCNADLQLVIADGADGSSCSVVPSLDALPGVVSDTIGSSLEGIAITVNGDPSTAEIATTTVEGATTFSATLDGLVAGNDQEICAVATASDAVGSGSISDCSTVDILAANTVIVDCEGTTICTGTATDPGKSTLAFSAPPEFDQTVIIAPDAGDAGACGGTTCKTGYSVGFPETTGAGPVASISVVTANKVSLRDRLNAAVYIDDTRITAQCNNRLLIAKVRNKLGIPEPIPCITITYQRDGRLEYFVKFNADPVFRFR